MYRFEFEIGIYNKNKAESKHNDRKNNSNDVNSFKVGFMDSLFEENTFCDLLCVLCHFKFINCHLLNLCYMVMDFIVFMDGLDDQDTMDLVDQELNDLTISDSSGKKKSEKKVELSKNEKSYLLSLYYGWFIREAFSL